jgi:hypothetical protein
MCKGSGKRQPFVSQEGIMAKPDFLPSINRRRMLISAAAVTATGILPGVKLADAAAADVLQSSPRTLEVEPANFCAATARRLTEIARRNNSTYAVRAQC